jgi:hypothetical protein
VTGPVTIDMAKVRQRKRDMVDREIALHLHNYQTSGGELIMGGWAFCGAENARGTPDIVGGLLIAGALAAWGA